MTCCSFVSHQISFPVTFIPAWTVGWRSRPAGESECPAPKVRAVSPNEDTVLLRKAVALVSKMILRQELEIRGLQAAVLPLLPFEGAQPHH